jgi:hypothetical protein
MIDLSSTFWNCDFKRTASESGNPGREKLWADGSYSQIVG